MFYDVVFFTELLAEYVTLVLWHYSPVHSNDARKDDMYSIKEQLERDFRLYMHANHRGFPKPLASPVEISGSTIVDIASKYKGFFGFDCVADPLSNIRRAKFYPYMNFKRELAYLENTDTEKWERIKAFMMREHSHGSPVALIECVQDPNDPTGQRGTKVYHTHEYLSIGYVLLEESFIYQ